MLALVLLATAVSAMPEAHNHLGTPASTEPMAYYSPYYSYYQTAGVPVVAAAPNTYQQVAQPVFYSYLQPQVEEQEEDVMDVAEEDDIQEVGDAEDDELATTVPLTYNYLPYT